MMYFIWKQTSGEIFVLEDVDFPLHKHESIVITSNIEIYLKHPLITFSYLSSIKFRHAPHHLVMLDNLAQNKCSYCRP